MQADGGAKLTIESVKAWVNAHPDSAALVVVIGAGALGIFAVGMRYFRRPLDIVDSAVCHVCTGRGMHPSEVCEASGIMYLVRALFSVAFCLAGTFFMLGSFWPLHAETAMQQAAGYSEATWLAVLSGIFVLCALRLAEPLRTRLVLRCNRCGYTVPRS